jgi:hypothetical protein
MRRGDERRVRKKGRKHDVEELKTSSGMQVGGVMRIQWRIQEVISFMERIHLFRKRRHDYREKNT